MILSPEVETRSWAERIVLDDASYRTQLRYLFERSSFYRHKLAEAALGTPAAAGGLAEIAQLPLTDEQELKATRTREKPLGCHLCVEREEIARVYSTSGTFSAHAPLRSPKQVRQTQPARQSAHRKLALASSRTCGPSFNR